MDRTKTKYRVCHDRLECVGPGTLTLGSARDELKFGRPAFHEIQAPA